MEKPKTPHIAHLLRTDLLWTCAARGIPLQLFLGESGGSLHSSAFGLVWYENPNEGKVWVFDITEWK